MALHTLLKKIAHEFHDQSLIVKESYGGSIFWWILSMTYCLIRYGARPIDYVRFEYHKKSHNERNRYMTFFRYFKMLKKLRKIGGAKFNAICGNKLTEYEIYKDYIHREWMKIDESVSRSQITEFISKNGPVIIKPVHGEQGKGIYKIHSGSDPDVDQILNHVNETCFIAESAVTNCEILSNFNPSSLNTIRVTTIYKNGKCDILSVVLRVGIKGSHVDNWGAGGVGYNFNIHTGICDQYGKDKKNNRYLFHPGTDYLMVGFKLPRYNELIQFVNKLTQVYPDAIFCGWDIALTPQGFELIEMNSPAGHDMFQSFDNPVWFKIKQIWNE